jgi:plastocyanin
MMRLGLALAALALGLCANLHAADLTIRLTNASGAPLADAVVFDPAAKAARGATPGRAIIVQHNRVFEPFVTVVQTGTAISFPNQDPMMHHVYSFSPAKHFEIKLYRGTPAEPVVFEKPGVVALGCNVHDWMLAYVLVVDTPLFAKSGRDGVLRLDGLAAGTHRLMAWYPGMREPVALPEITLAADEARTLAQPLDVPLKTRPPAPPYDPKLYSLLGGPPQSPSWILGSICQTSSTTLPSRSTNACCTRTSSLPR